MKSIRRLARSRKKSKSEAQPTLTWVPPEIFVDNSSPASTSGLQKASQRHASASPSRQEVFTAADGNTYTEDQLLYLTNEIKDYQIAHGSMLKVVKAETVSSVPARPVGTSILPTRFPKVLFEEARALQFAVNDLYVRVASDPCWLYEALGPLMRSDSLIAALWDGYVQVRSAGAMQMYVCGIFRSDYMLHQRPHNGSPQLKQVEVNTFYCAGACHAERIVKMHRHLQHVRGGRQKRLESVLPQNANTEAIVKLLAEAHTTYLDNISTDATPVKCVLMIVEHSNFNIADERPIEYGLWNRSIPCYRCEWQDVVCSTTLSDGRTLLLHPTTSDVEFEVSVVYYRAGFAAADYEDGGKGSRLRLEMSKAIKCPDILTHLTNMKAVQQALSAPGALQRFVPSADREKIRKTFMPMMKLDSSSEGLLARIIAPDAEQAMDYVLKPNRDGGGHNIYREDIPTFLGKVPEVEWHHYILMRLIEPPATTGALMMPADLHVGNVVSELGILGTCLWKRSADDASVQVIRNETAGFTFKTKPSDIDEMSVVKGYGCFDCPYLVD